MTTAGSSLEALLNLAAAIAAGSADIEERAADALESGSPEVSLDELILQSVLTVGWPRALVAAGATRKAIGSPSGEESADVDYSNHAEWTRRGEATCRVIYGDHYEKLRSNVRRLHPALEAWMVTEGYGRTLSRPGLGLKERELCTVVQTAVLRTAPQLHSHLLGALHAGAAETEIGAALIAARRFLNDADWGETIALWERVRNSQELSR